MADVLKDLLQTYTWIAQLFLSAYNVAATPPVLVFIYGKPMVHTNMMDQVPLQ